jgi:plastocyanin
VIDNQDDGVNHNLHLTDAPDEPATDLEAGPRVQELEVRLPAGDYEFVCDLHPTMVGTLHAGGQVP